MEPFIHIVVYDPTTITELLSTFTTYKVQTKTNLKGFNNAESTVSRRFRDFLWLYTTLQTKHPDQVVPAIPEKHLLGRFEEEFIQHRLLGLQRFLQKVGNHSVLAQDSNFISFLQDQHLSTSNDSNASKPFSEKLAGLLSSFRHTVKPDESDQWFETELQMLGKREAAQQNLARLVGEHIKKVKECKQQEKKMDSHIAELGAINLGESLDALCKKYVETRQQVDCINSNQQNLHRLWSIFDEQARIQKSIKACFDWRHQVFSEVQNMQFELTKAKEMGSSDASIALLESNLKEKQELYATASATLKEQCDAQKQEASIDFKDSLKFFLEETIKVENEKVSLLENLKSEILSLGNAIH